MELVEQLKRQRVKYIVSSYELDRGDDEAFYHYLDALLNTYPSPLIELALVETLVDYWPKVPLLRGYSFLLQAHHQLKIWEQDSIKSTVTPTQFQQITGLDPSPIFGISAGEPPARQVPAQS